jgi:hypothetical protein
MSTTLSRIQTLLSFLLKAIQENDELQYDEVSEWMEEIEELHNEYILQLGYYWEKLNRELYIAKGNMEEVKSEILEMLYQVDEMIDNM